MTEVSELYWISQRLWRNLDLHLGQSPCREFRENNQISIFFFACSFFFLLLWFSKDWRMRIWENGSLSAAHGYNLLTWDFQTREKFWFLLSDTLNTLNFCLISKHFNKCSTENGKSCWISDLAFLRNSGTDHTQVKQEIRVGEIPSEHISFNSPSHKRVFVLVFFIYYYFLRIPTSFLHSILLVFDCFTRKPFLRAGNIHIISFWRGHYCQAC